MKSKSYPVRSAVGSTVSLPKDWASHPCINRSNVESCTFEGLTEATVIHRSTLDNVTLRETPAITNTASKLDDTSDNRCSNRGCYIKFSHVTNSTLTKTNLRRCTVQESNFDTVSQAKWCNSHSSRLTNVQSLKRCDVVDTAIENVQSLERSTTSKATLKDCYKIKRAAVQESNVKSSIVCRSTLNGCEVNDCAIYKTDFVGMHLENGIWKRGALVGRIDQNKDVICTKISTNGGITAATDAITSSFHVSETSKGKKASKHEAVANKLSSDDIDPGEGPSSEGSDSDLEHDSGFQVPPPPYSG